MKFVAIPHFGLPTNAKKAWRDVSVTLQVIAIKDFAEGTSISYVLMHLIEFAALKNLLIFLLLMRRSLHAMMGPKKYFVPCSVMAITSAMINLMKARKNAQTALVEPTYLANTNSQDYRYAKSPVMVKVGV